MNAIPEPVLHSTRWDEPSDALGRGRVQERARRRRFVETLPEDEEPELICGEVVVRTPAAMQHNLVAGRLVAMLDACTRRGRPVCRGATSC
jgi:hypothetical protein